MTDLRELCTVYKYSYSLT